MNDKGAKEKDGDRLTTVEQIINNATTKDAEQAIFELCKYQLDAYNGFLQLGCRPNEARRQATAQVEAVLRAGRDDQQESQ